MVEWSRVKQLITKEEIEYVERKIGLILPRDYVETVIKYNGGRPDPYVIKDGYDMQHLYSLSQKDSLNALSIYEDKYQNEFQGLIFPFASDSFGNDFCFKYKTKNDTKPVVVFCDHETMEIDFIATSFSEFLDMLVESD